MKKLYTAILCALCLMNCLCFLSGCAGQSDTDKANELLDRAREAVARKSYVHARELIDSLRLAYPKEIDVRKAALVFMDTVELQQARLNLQASDSIATFKKFELEDLKKNFILEKQDKYQTTGYYVTKDYAGSKSSYDFFTEVEEGGTLLAVTINRASGIKYNFSQIDIDFTSDIIPACPISRSLTSREQASYEKCYQLAKCMQDLTDANSASQKYSLKVRFFEKKIEKDRDVLSAD